MLSTLDTFAQFYVAGTFIFPSNHKDIELKLNELSQLIESKYLVTQSQSFELKVTPAGLGLFAQSSIGIGKWLLIYYGEVISSIETRRRQSEIYDPQNLNYVLSVREYLRRPSIDDPSILRSNFDATIHGGIARFINHSCNPNCEVILYRETSDQVIGIPIITSIVQILPGEEITIDYGSKDLEPAFAPGNSIHIGNGEILESADNEAKSEKVRILESPATNACDSVPNAMYCQQSTSIDHRNLPQQMKVSEPSFETMSYCHMTNDESDEKITSTKHKKSAGKRKKCLCNSKWCKGSLPYDGTL